MTDIKTSDIRAHIKRYAHANDRLAVWALAQTTLGQLVALLLYGVDQIAIAVVLEAGILCRTFVIFHDGIHYSYFRRRQANQKLATLLQAWVITPINHWQRNHFHHHRYFGNLDIQDHADTVFFTRQQYESFPPGKRRLARFLRDPVVFFLLAPIAQWWIEYPFLKGNRYVWLGHTVHLLLAWQLSWWHLFAIYLSGMLALMLFHLQHAVNRSYRETDPKWTPGQASLLGATYLPLPPPITWFTFGIEFHHIHHINTAAPGYVLARCHKEAPPGMWHEVTTPTLWQGLASLRNVMWDEESKQLVPF